LLPRKETPEEARDIMRTYTQHWASAFFLEGSFCELVDNNFCEIFKHAIVDARFYPITSMQEKIRKKIFTRIQELMLRNCTPLGNPKGKV
jgi:hypothetical protein